MAAPAEILPSVGSVTLRSFCETVHRRLRLGDGGVPRMRVALSDYRGTSYPSAAGAEVEMQGPCRSAWAACPRQGEKRRLWEGRLRPGSCAAREMVSAGVSLFPSPKAGVNVVMALNAETLTDWRLVLQIVHPVEDLSAKRTEDS